MQDCDPVFGVVRRTQEVSSLVRQIAMNVVKPQLPEYSRMELVQGTPYPVYEDELGDNNSWCSLSMIHGFNLDEVVPAMRAGVMIQVNLVDDFDIIYQEKLPRRRYGRMAIVGISDAGSLRAERVHSELLYVTLPDDLIRGKYGFERIPLNNSAPEVLFDGPADLEELEAGGVDRRILEAYREAQEEIG